MPRHHWVARAAAAFVDWAVEQEIAKESAFAQKLKHLLAGYGRRGRGSDNETPKVAISKETNSVFASWVTFWGGEGPTRQTICHFGADEFQAPGKGRSSIISTINLRLWLDRATIQFRFIGHAATYTESFCVFGPVLSSPAHASSSLAMPQIGIEIF
jgi:hypothetical protein